MHEPPPPSLVALSLCLATALGCARRPEPSRSHAPATLEAHPMPPPSPSSSAAAAPPVDVSAVATEMAAAARALLASLGDEQRRAASFAFEGDERFRWHYTPIERRGLSLGAMSAAQRPLAHALLKTALSPRGYLNATQIVELEAILRELEGSERRDPARYFVSIFGEPGPRGAWGWRFEGHHLSFHATIVEGRFVAPAPAFFGANPARVPAGQKLAGQRTLAPEEDLGRALLASLPGGLRREALLAETAFPDITSGIGRRAEIGEPKGVPFARLPAEQQARLRGLVEHYARRLRDELADAELLAIERAGWDNVCFAWAGGAEAGQPHYYRLQGPTFLVEYDNTQNGANHIHTVWRDLQNDFGADLLRDHYEAHRGDREHGHR
ncbi:MAG TPA: DUF3500 domain-containing protein [Polyangiaceae bacterium]|nr:DUF3500 domain-containing protein [Polyangiaceae bacterium]